MGRIAAMNTLMAGTSPAIKELYLPTQARIGPALDLRRSDALLGLMRIERARACSESLGQDLHCEQFGVDLRLECTGRAGHARRAVVRFVRTKSNIPNIAILHAGITHVT